MQCHIDFLLEDLVTSGSVTCQTSFSLEKSHISDVAFSFSKLELFFSTV